MTDVTEYLRTRLRLDASTSQSAIAQVRMLRAAGKEAICVLGQRPYVLCWERDERL